MSPGPNFRKLLLCLSLTQNQTQLLVFGFYYQFSHILWGWVEIVLRKYHISTHVILYLVDYNICMIYRIKKLARCKTFEIWVCAQQKGEYRARLHVGDSTIRGSFQKYEVSLSRLLMTLWPLNNSYFPTNPTFHQFHDLDTDFDLHRITSVFHGAFATGMAYQQGRLTLPDTWFRPPFWDLLMLKLLRPNSSNLSCLYSTFYLEYPLVLSRFCI